MDIYNEVVKAEMVKFFLAQLGEAGRIADKVSDMILFHNRVRENAKKRYMLWT